MKFFSKNLNQELLNKSSEELHSILKVVLEEKVKQLDAKEALKFLFGLDQAIYLLEGQQAIRYGDGTHTKHKHMNYHKFFTDNILQGENVLDIGCSFGQVTSDVAKKVNTGKVVGIEIEEFKVVQAKETYKDIKNLEFVHADATKWSPDIKFDVITLSNVLEHIKDRPGLLKTLIKKYNPKKFLIRVPTFDRDWRVPLKKELGLDYFLDDTHFIEFTDETFAKEMREAGLEIVSKTVNWGEIWAVLKPIK